MEHVYSLKEARPDRPTLLTIGSFDGVHRGHQELVIALASAADKLGLDTVVLTFFPHPSVFLQKRKPPFYLNRPQEKADLLAELGVNWVITYPFDDFVRKQTAHDFLQRLRSALDFRQLWCGPDFAFGHGREGTIEWLRTHASRLGYELRVVDPVIHGESAISSSRVRDALRSGNVREVRHCLGRHLRVPGTVVAETDHGNTIGIPTANISIWGDRAHPAVGVYAGYAQHSRGRSQALVNISCHSTFDTSQKAVSIRVHLLDHQVDLSGEKLYIDFVERLRPEIICNTSDSLATQIQEDIAQARLILSGSQAKQVVSN